jgi:putative glutamate/gamma-aminobutyrate antiporter
MIKKEKISPFILAMITIALLGTLRGLTFLAGYGIGSIFFYFISAFFFLIPIALISAELATAWPERGGIFLWIEKAFGDKWGFVATFLQWMESVIWYPTALSFIAVTFAYLIDPSLAENKYYVVSMVLIVFWGGTFINFRGLKFSGWVSTFAVIFGTILPAIVMISLAIFWVVKGNPLAISFELKNLIPDFSNIQNVVFLAGSFLVFSGIEVSAVHVKDVEHPRKSYPRALFLAISVILAISIFGTLSIAIVIPKDEISLTSGVMQAFTSFFKSFNLMFLVPFIAALISFGGLGQILSWIIGPSKSVLESARRGDLPPWFKKTNKHEIPINILIAQAVVVSVLSVVFLMMPSVSSSFWMLSVLAIQDYILMYVLLYLAAIKLRYKYPDVKRPYQVPGKKWGIWVLSFIGLFAIIAVFFISFIPPSNLLEESKIFFVSFLIIGIIFLVTIPLMIYHFKNKWKS